MSVGAYLYAWFGVAGVREWFAAVVVVAWAACFIACVRAELVGRTRFAWGLPILLFLVPWAVAGLQLVYILLSKGANQ